MRPEDEQIAEIKERLEDLSLVNCYPDFSEIQDWMIEAERRAEQRVRAEIGRDSERLDWLAGTDTEIIWSPNGPTRWALRFSTPFRSFDRNAIRQAIDAAREVKHD